MAGKGGGVNRGYWMFCDGFARRRNTGLLYLTGGRASLTDTPSNLTSEPIMGQQSNKIQKRRRRLAYLERLKIKAKESAVTKAPKKKPAAKKKAEPVAVPAA